MSEFTKKEVSAVLQHFAALLEVPVASLHVLMVATVSELLGDWQAVLVNNHSIPRSIDGRRAKEAPHAVVQGAPSCLGTSTTTSHPQQSTSLRVTTARLEEWMQVVFDDVSSACDRFFTEPMIQVLWIAVQQHPSLRGRRVEMFVGCPRTSAESIIIALTLQAFLETRSTSALFGGVTMDDLLGVVLDEETSGGGLVEYVEGLLEGCCS